MSFRHFALWSARALVCLVPASLAQAGVHIVDASGQGNFTTIQTAVNASIDGDVILVRGGSYAGFSIGDRSLAIFSDVGANVQVSGTLAVTGLSDSKTIVVSGITVHGTSTTPAPTVALSLANNAGALRFQKCTFIGGNGLHVFPNNPPAADGVALVNDRNVAFVACTLRGGDGWTDSTQCYECHGGNGGAGVIAHGSTVALHDTLCQGGLGGEAGELGGRGGDGYHAFDAVGFASRTTFRGGKGGNAWDFIYAAGGNGGNALWVESAATFHLVSPSFVPGAGGVSYLFPDQSGGPGASIFGGGTTDTLPGPARVFTSSVMADDAGAIELTVFGQPGDRVFLPGAFRTSFKYQPALSGMLLIPMPAYLPVDPIAVIPAAGSVTVQASVLALPSGVDAAVSFLQGFIIDSDGNHSLGSPIDALTLRCATLAPDCNGNARFDSCDLFQLVSTDCDVNSIPDECQADCNGNGVADSCDISSHTSQDTNHNGVPDECEPVNATWYVDASAPSGGNGSSSNPFQTIAQGLAASLSGHTVIVRDGIYTGSSNRNLDFGGRNIVVKSANGPANCIIDCQLASRAFTLHTGETASARIEGVTIKNGSSQGSSYSPSEAGAIHVWNASPTIQNCVFSNCTAFADGGAIFVFNSNALIRDCTFTGNQVTNHGNAAGGAIELVYEAPRIVHCLISGNVAPRYGGGLAVFSSTALIESCAIVANTASQFDGGAVYTSGSNVRFDDCLVAGIVASNGGGFAGNSQLTISSSTVVGNRAGARGGGIAHTGPQGLVVNSVLWGNTAPDGAQIVLMNSGAGISVSYCDVQGGQAGITIDPGSTLTWGAGNIAVDPAFVDPDGPDNNPLTFGDNDYRLSLASPCIDAGDNSSVAADTADLDGDADTSEPIPFDLGFLPRFRDIASVPDTGNGTAPIVDIGAYERQP
jgi:hypothetical protein